ncbi:hypothetical protein PGB90_009720 [Kerria lacca]
MFAASGRQRGSNPRFTKKKKMKMKIKYKMQNYDKNRRERIGHRRHQLVPSTCPHPKMIVDPET